MNVEYTEKLFRKKTKEHYDMVNQEHKPATTEYWVDRTIKHIEAEAAKDLYIQALKSQWAEDYLNEKYPKEQT